MSQARRTTDRRAAKSSGRGGGKGSMGKQMRAGQTLDKIAKASMSKEMLAAGLAAAAAAISASPKARRKIHDAGLDAAETASQAASNVVSSATKLGSIIAEAVADAAQRVASGKWDAEGDATDRTRKRSSRVTSRSPRAGTMISKSGRSKTSKTGGRVFEVTITEGLGFSDSAEADLVKQVQDMVDQSGAPADFDALTWVHDWIHHEVPALDGKRPIDLLGTKAGRELVSTTLARMQSGAYA